MIAEILCTPLGQKLNYIISSSIIIIIIITTEINYNT